MYRQTIGDLEEAAIHFLPMLFVQRLRTPEDRTAAQGLAKLSGLPISQSSKPSTSVLPEKVEIGWATLQRNTAGSLLV